MTPFSTVTGPAASILQDNVDTDVIIRIERLTSASTREELGQHALEAMRLLPDGKEDPAFALNQTAYHQAPIVITGRNFGCGSSREGAVWALQARGIRCLIGESFGDIFYANCFQNGVLPVRMAPDAVTQIRNLARNGQHVTVDLSSQRITLPRGEAWCFDIDPVRREAMLEGLDDIAQTLKRSPAITAWQALDRTSRPWAWAARR